MMLVLTPVLSALISSWLYFTWHHSLWRMQCNEELPCGSTGKLLELGHAIDEVQLATEELDRPVKAYPLHSISLFIEAFL